MAKEPAWLIAAREKVGTRELPGPTHNNKLFAFLNTAAKFNGLTWKEDEMPLVRRLRRRLRPRGRRRAGEDRCAREELGGVGATCRRPTWRRAQSSSSAGRVAATSASRSAGMITPTTYSAAISPTASASHAPPSRG